LDSREVFEVAELLSLCREKLDIPARDKGHYVSFIIILDCCRVAIPSIKRNMTLFEPEKAPITYTVYYSCRRGGEAKDGLTGAHSPFAKELLNPNGIFSKGRSLEEGLKEANLCASAPDASFLVLWFGNQSTRKDPSGADAHRFAYL
jgi:hypothetical protein